jgi:hypothetical protein
MDSDSHRDRLPGGGRVAFIENAHTIFSVDLASGVVNQITAKPILGSPTGGFTAVAPESAPGDPGPA